NEFMDIYGLDVLEVPTNVAVARADEHDEVYRTFDEKSRAIVAEIADCHRRGQPVLVGTTSIEKSEQLSELLRNRTYIRDLGQYFKKQADGLKAGKEDDLRAQLNEVATYLTNLGAKNSGTDVIPHQVLNARYHEQEAHIIAQAGMPGTVTIATNMAGRGTDIQLGGNPRYRIRDWIKDVIDAGRGAGPQIDDIYYEWVDHCLSEFSASGSGNSGTSRRGALEWVGAELDTRVGKGALGAEEA